jgi:uncharacterized protein YukE
MPTLHMEVETARAAQTSMSNGGQQMQAAFNDMNGKVTVLEGAAWQGNSATEFFAIYNEMKSVVVQNLDKITELAERLGLEITEWENMAAKFGNSAS